MYVTRYQEKFKDEFIKLNKSWIEKFFALESHDLEQLDHIEDYLNQGAMIYFGIEEEQVLSTCMAVQLEEGVWEICKFATNEKFQGKGAGKAVFKASIGYAIEQGAQKIVIYSNHILKPAIHIYQSFGFNEVPVTIDDYQRCNYQAELMVE